MNFNSPQFTQVIEEALTHAAGNTKWEKAIERAAEGLKSGAIVVSELANGCLVTTENGTYKVNGGCPCTAYRNGHKQCKHRAARRLCALYSETLIVKHGNQSRIETRTFEQDRTGARYEVVRYDGWPI